jgi:hypothetical protein
VHSPKSLTVRPHDCLGSKTDVPPGYQGMSALPSEGDIQAAAMSLSDAKSGQYIWSEKFDGTLHVSEVMKAAMKSQIEVVRALTRPYGVIFSTKVNVWR